MNRLEFYSNLDQYKEKDNEALEHIKKNNGIVKINPDGTWKDHKYLYKDGKGNYIYEYNKPKVKVVPKNPESKVINNPINGGISNTLSKGTNPIEVRETKKNIQEKKDKQFKEDIQKAASGREAAETTARNQKVVEEQEKKFKEDIQKAVSGREAAENKAKKDDYQNRIDEEKRKREEARNELFRVNQANRDAAIKKAQQDFAGNMRAARKHELDEKIHDLSYAISRYDPDRSKKKMDIDDDIRKYLEAEIKKEYTFHKYDSIEDFLDPSLLGGWLVDSRSERNSFLKDKLMDYQDEMNKKIDKDIDIKEKAAEKELTPINTARKAINKWKQGDKLDIKPELRSKLEKVMKEEYDSWIYKYDDLEDFLDRFMLDNVPRKNFLVSLLNNMEKEILKKHGLDEE